jgi:hypothetical protein
LAGTRRACIGEGAMLTIAPTGVVRGIDVARPWREPALGQLLLALDNQGVLRLPDQHRDLGTLKGCILVSCGSCGRKAKKLEGLVVTAFGPPAACLPASFSPTRRLLFIPHGQQPLLGID